MNNKDFKKNFIENFKEQNNPNILFEDTFDKELTQNNIYYNRYISLKKRHKLQTIFSCVLILLLILGMSIVLIKYKDNVSKTSQIYELSEEEINIMKSYTGKVEEKPYMIINLSGINNLYLYKVHYSDEDLLNNYVYFYKVVNFQKIVEIKSNTNLIQINKNNIFGIIGKITDEEILKFKVFFGEKEIYCEIN